MSAILPRQAGAGRRLRKNPMPMVRPGRYGLQPVHNRPQSPGLLALRYAFHFASDPGSQGQIYCVILGSIPEGKTWGFPVISTVPPVPACRRAAKEAALSLGELYFQAGVLGEDDFMSPSDPGVEHHLADLVIGKPGNQSAVRRRGADDPG